MDLLDRLLGHDAWTTRRLLDLAAGLGDAQLDRDFALGHGSVRRTLEHVLWNLECWTDLMKGEAVRPRPADGAPVADLTRRHEAASAELLRFAREVADKGRLDEEFLDALDDPPRRKSLGGAIVHLATHGMHHRAQLLYMLRRLGVGDLPEGDALSWEEAQRNKEARTPPRHLLDADPTPTEMAFLDARLEEFNARQAGRDDFKPFHLVVRGDAGEVVAGLKAVTGWDWLYVQILWVHEDRRRAGLGSKLLLAAEAEGRRRGCIGSCLSSYSFQAPAFYHRHGYATFGQIDDYPPGHTMHFLSKRFPGDAP